MKKFVTPEIEVTKFMIKDVITVSTEEIIYGEAGPEECILLDI